MSVSQSLAPFPTLALEPAASRSCNNGAAEGRAGGEALKACPRRAGRSDEEEINSGVKCSALVQQIATCGVRPPRRPRARVRRAAALVEREAVKWDLNHDVAVVVSSSRFFSRSSSA